jgi:SAM-dependent methyltransferase
MIFWNRCPACQSADLVAVVLPSNVCQSHIDRYGAGIVTDGKYAVCRRCELLFARQRQGADEADSYYQAFAALEKRDYTTYPPPRKFLDAQTRLADKIARLLDQHDLFASRPNTLHVRCECGILLAHLRDNYGIRELHGLDHFESNLRFATLDLGLDHVSFLHPVDLNLPQASAPFDLILANHQLTHALDPTRLLQVLRGALSENGCLVLYNELHHMPLLRQRHLYKSGVISYHKQLLTQRSLENYCRLVGLRPRLVDYDTAGISWASGSCSMMVLAWRDEPLPAEQLAPARRLELLAAIRQGKRKHWLHELERRLWPWNKSPARNTKSETNMNA